MGKEPKALRIIIDAVGGTEQSTVTVGEDVYIVNGLALFADGGDQQLISFTWGSPAIAAAGCVKSFAQAIRSDNKFAVEFYQYLLRFMVKVTGVQGLNELTAEDALRMFDAKEIYEAMKDPKRFN